MEAAGGEDLDVGGANAETCSCSFTIRAMRQEDVKDAGKVIYMAFYMDSIATGVPPSFQVGSPEDAARHVDFLLALPETYNVVAVDGKGKLLGGACSVSGDRHAHAVGPVFVSPDESDRGIGKALTKTLVERALKLKAPSIRLITSAANRKSFSLYANLGFRPVECTSAFHGTVPLDAVEKAAAIVGICTRGTSTRKMEEADVKACAEIFRKGMGYDREKNIRIRLSQEPDRCWLATTDDNTILGYTTGVKLAGHTITTSEAAWVAVVSRAIQEQHGDVGCISIPGVHYPRLIQWAMAAKLVLASTVGTW